MLADKDLDWYARLLASAIAGKAKIGFSDATRVIRCGVAAQGDVRLRARTLEILFSEFTPAAQPQAGADRG